MTFIQSFGAVVTLATLIYFSGACFTSLLRAVWFAASLDKVVDGKLAIKAILSPFAPVMKHVLTHSYISTAGLVVLVVSLLYDFNAQFIIGLISLVVISAHALRFSLHLALKVVSPVLRVVVFKWTLDSFRFKNGNF